MRELAEDVVEEGKTSYTSKNTILQCLKVVLGILVEDSSFQRSPLQKDRDPENARIDTVNWLRHGPHHNRLGRACPDSARRSYYFHLPIVEKCQLPNLL